MRKTVLGRTGLEVSAVGFGGIPIQRISEDEAVAVVHRCLELGVTFLDTAAGYGDSQKKIGRAIAGRRDGLVLASKSGCRDKAGMLADIDRSRREMGTDVIDLYQLHGVSNEDAWRKVREPGGALAALLEAREKGHIGHIGVTSHSLDLSLELIEDPVFETLQFPFNLVTAEPAEKLIPRCRELGLGFIVMKPLCGGQYDDAELAFKFLNAFGDLVAIPGIERVEEIEQIAGLVASGETLAGADKIRAEKIAAELGKEFCRRCGYCMPCPHDVPIGQAMLIDSFLKRLPQQNMKGIATHLTEKGTLCVDCGICETKCPYDLPIRRNIKDAVAKAQKFLNENP